MLFHVLPGTLILLRRYGTGDPASKLIARYAQARFSVFPNIIRCISNDQEIVTETKLTGRQVTYNTINQIGQDMAAKVGNLRERYALVLPQRYTWRYTTPPEHAALDITVPFTALSGFLPL